MAYEHSTEVISLAYHDALTGLPNRVRLDDALTAALARRKGATATAVLFIDLDDFKAVNDRHGHSAGDALLRQVAARLRSAVRADDLLARQGGDEFLLLLTDLPRHNARAVATRAADQLLHAFREPFDVHGTTLGVAASIGISVDTGHAACADDLLRTADAAMYTAKRDGGAQHHGSAETGRNQAPCSGG